MSEQHASALLLRPWAETDGPGLRAAIDEDVDHLKPWLSWTLEEPATLERTQDRLRRWIEQYRSGEGYRYAITPLDRPSLILGGAGLNHRLAPAVHTVGYWVRRSATRQGIAAAAVSKLTVDAFAGRGVDRLVIQCDVANAASAAFARALGFELTGEVAIAYPDGTPRPVLQFEMARDDYRLRHGPALRDRARRVHLATDTAGA